VAPDRTAIRAREAALDRLIDDAKSANGVLGNLRRCRRPSRADALSLRARDVLQPEFAADVKRYELVVSAVPLTIQVQDCREFESLVEQALSAK
jgi:hypothetical protein